MSTRQVPNCSRGASTIGPITDRGSCFSKHGFVTSTASRLTVGDAGSRTSTQLTRPRSYLGRTPTLLNGWSHTQHAGASDSGPEFTLDLEMCGADDRPQLVTVFVNAADAINPGDTLTGFGRSMLS